MLIEAFFILYHFSLSRGIFVDVMAPLLFYVNGKEIIDDNIEPEWTVLWYLRNSMSYFRFGNVIENISLK